MFVGTNWQKLLKLIDPAQSSLFDLFMIDKRSQPDITYVKWLETLVLAAMPHLKPKED